MIARLALFWTTFASLLWGQVDSRQEDVMRLAGIRRAIASHLENMPNYTCLQTVERYHLALHAKKEELVDILRLEVAYLAGREMYAWPGSSRFEDRELREIISTGAFSTGGFVLHARAIFLGEEASFQYAGEETLDGKPTWRYDYEVPQRRSGYQIRNPVKSIMAAVGYHGSIWADRRTNALVRISVLSREIPEEIQIKSAADQLDYQPVQIGAVDALLPRQGVIKITDEKGDSSINRTRLSRCKQYSGESTISFEDIPDGNASVAKPQRLVELPPHLEIELALDQELDHANSAVGDSITATLRNDLRVKKTLIAPKGSIARGRIVRFEHSHDTFSTYQVAFSFEELAGVDWRAPLSLKFVRLAVPSLPPFDLSRRSNLNRMVALPRVTGNEFLVFSEKLRLPRGFVTIWQTQ